MTELNDLGVQPLDALMTRLKLTNHDLVAVSANQLTHKMVAKGRKGRKLTVNAQYKILSAFQALRPQNPVTLKELFNY
ncbi:MAG TPA: hypothetical protein PL155_02975 [Candidatus Omnitrophota bacterium]|nr:hypothetical protein [Candidatus Omnitrophota bacterium]HPD84555.1 hypothetical protein [Candidatus Omnitrophota bacterium]HRZ03413.1 hypothetical protein [Candidatus Omnitrophota bacterium]